MTDRDLLQQALEKLEFFAHMKGVSEDTARLIAALRERLAQPNEFNPDWDAMAVMVEEQQRMAKRIAELEAQPEQESVKFNCTVVDDAHPEGVPLSQWGQQQKQKPFCYHDGRNIVGKEYAHHCDVFPLYTEPHPEQEPLTDEEIADLWGAQIFHVTDLKLAIDFVRDIERAHGIGETPDAA